MNPNIPAECETEEQHSRTRPEYIDERLYGTKIEGLFASHGQKFAFIEQRK